MKRYVVNLASISNPEIAGTKAYNLHLMQRWGFRVPKTFVCTIEAFDDFTAGNQKVTESIRVELNDLLNDFGKYAIRSSTNVEDGSKFSFAGQFNTFLDIDSLNGVIDAIQQIWKIKEERIQSYLNRVGAVQHTFKTGVIIQEMIDSKIAGVVFTRNPLTRIDEIIVEMVEGQGVSLAQQGITPGRFIFRSGNWVEISSTHKAYINIIEVVVKASAKISKKYGNPVDLEWAFNGHDIYWLQLRQITRSNEINVFSNRISKEMLPGMIKPLVWSINIPVVNSSWKRIFYEMIGKAANGVDVHNLAKPIYYRAYFNMGVIGNIFKLLGMPRDSLEMMMAIRGESSSQKLRMRPGFKALRYLPRFMIFLFGKVRFQKQTELFFSRRKVILEKMLDTDITRMNESEIIESIQELIRLNQETSYYTIISQLLAGIYSSVLRRYIKKVDINHKTIISPDPEVIKEINLTSNIEKLRQAWMELSENTRLQILENGFGTLALYNEASDFKKEITGFFRLFGHYSESSVDLSRKTWRENPNLVLNMITNYQPPVEFDTKQILSYIHGFPVSAWRKILISYLYKRTIKFLNIREKTTYLYNFGYGLFRPRFQRLARLFLDKGYIDEEEDIYYYQFNEIEDIINNKAMPKDYLLIGEKRKTEMLLYGDVTLPEVVIGDSLPPLVIKLRASDTIKGTPVSGGYAEGPVKVIRTFDDFPKVEDNDILVIPYSDISWTPIFTRAQAIISESGGFLSHCAIVAREFGIPAVVAVNDIKTIADGDIISVNGFTGEILRIKVAGAAK